MHESVTLDDVDRKIINVLQIRPRAPWSLVGSVAGVDPATAARRWARLSDAGAAWISCYPVTRSAGHAFLVQLTCDPGKAGDVAVTLAGDPNVATVNVTAGGYDVQAEAGAVSLGDTARYSLGRLAMVPGIRSARTLPVAKMYSEGSRWRLRALDGETEARLAASGPKPPQPNGSPPPFGDDDWELLRCLAADPRMPLNELGQRLGVSPSTASRRLGAVADGRIQLRCELARGLSGWPVCGAFSADCPAARLDATGRALAKIPEVRAVVSLIGPFNLHIVLWLRSAEQVQEFESQLNARAPYVSVVDRGVVLRPVKQMGQLVDEDGFRIGSVPIDARSVP